MKRLFVLFILLLLLYWKITQAGFVFDDRFLIVQNDSWSLERIWLSELWGDSEDRTGFYRPLFLCSIYLDRLLFGLKPLGYHIHSFIWQVILVFSFWLLLSSKQEYFEFSEHEKIGATAVFAFHPFLSETVYWISARNDSMCLSFSLFALFFVWRERPKWFLGGLCFFAALLSKETASALLPAVLFLDKKHRIRLFFLFGILFLGWIFIRSMVLENPQSLLIQSSYLQKLPFVFLDQFARLWLPLNLSPVHTLNGFSIRWWEGLLGGTTLVLLGLTFWKEKRVRFWMVFGFGAMILTIPPMMHTGVFGERYWIYLLPMWGIVILQTLNWRILFPLILFWFPQIWMQGDVWKDDYSFWESQYSQNPSSFSAVSFAHISYEKKHLAQAYQLYQEGYSVSQPYLYGCDNFLTLALKLEGAKKTIEAFSWLQDKTEQACWGGAGWGILGVAYAVEEDWEQVGKILAQNYSDPYRRLDLVKAIVYLREENSQEFCKIWNSWSNQDNLERQIEIISSGLTIVECHE